MELIHDFMSSLGDKFSWKEMVSPLPCSVAFNMNKNWIELNRINLKKYSETTEQETEANKQNEKEKVEHNRKWREKVKWESRLREWKKKVLRKTKSEKVNRKIRPESEDRKWWQNRANENSK